MFSPPFTFFSLPLPPPIDMVEMVSVASLTPLPGDYEGISEALPEGQTPSPKDYG